MYLKTTRNGASFSEYKNFIEQNSEYPRINRIRFLAEGKIYLRNKINIYEGINYGIKKSKNNKY